jgi:hypothetical protein
MILSVSVATERSQHGGLHGCGKTEIGDASRESEERAQDDEDERAAHNEASLAASSEKPSRGRHIVAALFV